MLVCQCMQEAVDASVLSRGYDMVGVSETWWAESHISSAGREGYQLFSRVGRAEEVVMLLCI